MWVRAGMNRPGVITILVVLVQLLPVGVAHPHVAVGPATVHAFAPSTSDFQRTWARTDQPVATGLVNRTWMWGPAGISDAVQEPYAESPGGMRTVQYFDKSRMEITDPSGDPASVWYVTNGLLVVELMTGRVQLGADTFEDWTPAEINVAGDGDDDDAPTYRTFATLRAYLPFAVGGVLTQRIDRSATARDDASLGQYQVTAAILDDMTNHTVASVFWEFMNQTGTVWEDDRAQVATLFEHPYYATGRPIAEAYWATVAVGGTPQDVLIQCFERRCLTYTPENPAGWQVEAGNVGLHYYAWRHATPQPQRGIVFVSGRDWDGERFDTEIYVMDADGSDQRRLTSSPGEDIDPVWSPDGRRVAFASARQQPPSTPDDPYRWDIWVIDADGSNPRRVTFDGHASEPAWSPDGQSIAYVSQREDGSDIFVTGVDAFEPRNVSNTRSASERNPAWSPDGQSIVFVGSAYDAVTDVYTTGVYVMGNDGSDVRPVSENAGESYLYPDWSPDGSQIAFNMQVKGTYTIGLFVCDRDGSNMQPFPVFDGYVPSWSSDGTQITFMLWVLGVADIFVANADGSNLRNVSNHPSVDASPDWSPVVGS
jgi:hypothetical protein